MTIVCLCPCLTVYLSVCLSVQLFFCLALLFVPTSCSTKGHLSAEDINDSHILNLFTGEISSTFTVVCIAYAILWSLYCTSGAAV